uniref:Cyclin C-terminal domain-containing protein n=1 Tax=Timema cristinae TaxID=61476 RepID=A0A7R9GXG0_TIMCR|nr:unnamed protein product [Timema cristinae]
MTKLLRLCENVYSQKDMLYMEEKLLKSTNFQFNLGQPMVFVHYYLDADAESTSEMVNTCNYLLDVLLLNSDFASVTPSRLAAGAVYTAFSLNNKQNKYKNRNCTRFYQVQDIIQINKAMLSELDKRKPGQVQKRDRRLVNKPGTGSGQLTPSWVGGDSECW